MLKTKFFHKTKFVSEIIEKRKDEQEKIILMDELEAYKKIFIFL